MKLTFPLCAMFTLLLASGVAVSDDGGKWFKHAPGVPPVENTLYEEECGSCHFAFQPALLPGASWKKLMSNLDNHFGENAELPEQTRVSLYEYLSANAADKVSGYKRSTRIMRSLGHLAPLRITDIPYIHRQHHGIPSRIIKNNPDIRSLSNCANCHTRAAAGSYAEREISIPGIAFWDDD